MRRYLTWRIALFVGVDWSALGSWLLSVNWVATSTTVGVVIFNVTLGITAAWNHVRAQRLKWRREDEEVNKESLRHQSDVKDRTIAERDRRIADLERELIEKDKYVEMRRVEFHEHREAINADSLMRINEANELRKVSRDLQNEVASLRREVDETRRSAGAPSNHNPARDAQ